MVPECYSPLLPPKPEPYFKYQVEGGNGLPGASQVQTLTELLRKKPTPEEVLELVQQLPNPLKGKFCKHIIRSISTLDLYLILTRRRRRYGAFT